MYHQRWLEPFEVDSAQNCVQTYKGVIIEVKTCDQQMFFLDIALDAQIPSIQKMLRVKFLRSYFPIHCAKLSQSIEINVRELLSGRLRNFCCCSLLSCCFCTILPGINLAQWPFCHCVENFLESYFWLDCAKIRVMIARKCFRGINCVAFSERRVVLLTWWWWWWWW